MKREKARADNKPKDDRISIRVGSELLRILPELIKDNNAKDVSEYVRGLIFEDARARRKDLDGVPVPGHLTARILRMQLGSDHEKRTSH